MELEVEGLTGAAYGGSARSAWRTENGYRDRSWESGAGTVELRILKLRRGSLLPGLSRTAADGRKGAHGGIAYVQCVSTRSVDGLGAGDGHVGISKRRLCAEIDDRAKTFLQRPLEGDWPYLWS